MGGPASLRIRPGRPDDAPRLTAIAHQTKAHWGYPDRWLAAWRDALTVTGADLDRLEILVAEERGAVAGFVALELEEAGWSLAHCWVRPADMGRGIGRALVAEAAARLSVRGVSRLRIVSDPNAVGFYHRLGAVAVGAVRADVAGERRELPLLELALDPP